MPFRLLDLPLEIQRMIYVCIFTLPARGLVTRGVSLTHSPSRASTSVLRMLTCSRQVFKECLPLFYSLNALRLSTPTQLWYFLRSLPTERRQWIRELVVSGFGPSWRGSLVAPQAFSMLQLLPRLTDFNLDLEVMDPEMGAYYEWTELLDVLNQTGLISLTQGNVFEHGKWHWIDFDSFSSAAIALTSLRGVRLGRVWGMPKVLTEADASEESVYHEVHGAWVKELRNLMAREKAGSKTSSKSTRFGKSNMVMGAGGQRIQYLLKRFPSSWETEALYNKAGGTENYKPPEPDTDSDDPPLDPTSDQLRSDVEPQDADVRDQDGVNVDRRMVNAI